MSLQWILKEKLSVEFMSHILDDFISSADDVSSAELMVLLICLSSVVRPSTFALNRYSSCSSYSIILNFLLEKLAI